MAGQEPGQPRDGQPAELGVRAPPLPLGGGESIEEIEVGAADRGERRKRASGVDRRIIRAPRPVVLIHPDDRDAGLAQDQTHPAAPEQLEVRQVREDLAGRPFVRI